MREVAWAFASCALVAAVVAAMSASPARADIVAPPGELLPALESALRPPPKPPATSKASASVPTSSSATPSVPVATTEPQTRLAGFDAEPFPDEASKAPTPEEWKAAKELAPTRRGARAEKCHVWRVREWIRVSCPELVTASLAHLGGTPTGMSFWIDPPREGKDAKLPAGGEVLFPVRKGDRRVVQFLSFGPGYEGPFTQLPALVVQELWLEGAEGPELLLY